MSVSEIQSLSENQLSSRYQWKTKKYKVYLLIDHTQSLKLSGLEKYYIVYSNKGKETPEETSLWLNQWSAHEHKSNIV